MNGSTHLNSPGVSTGTNPVFSPAVRFAPKELSPSQVIRLVAYWVAIRVSIIAIALVMARSGVSYLSHVWSERPAHQSVR
ncbi:MAG: hypothetical protein V7609_2885 [Verrucomicrobiota bacterium]